jgi:magnesium transporter
VPHVDDDLRRLLRGRDTTSSAALSAALSTTPPRDLAQALRFLSAHDLRRVISQVDDTRAEQVMPLLDGGVQAELFRALPENRATRLFTALDPDDRARLLQQLPKELSRTLQSSLTGPAADATRQLMAYPPRSAGRAMSPHVLNVRVGEAAGSALERVRRAPEHVETIYMLPVTDAADVVVGVLSLRRLVTTDAATPVAEVMSSPAVTVSALAGQEEAARAVRRAQLIAAPVVDEAGRLVGVLTVDDAMRILSEAEDEDVARGTGSGRLRRSYLVTPVSQLVRARLGWLLVLILAATLTVNVLDHFEDVLAEVVALALFVPLLIGTGGNVGAQSATTVVRAMAVGDVESSDLPRVLAREVVTGALMGFALAAVGFLPAMLFVSAQIAAVVSMSLVTICVLAAAMGSLTPMVARMLGIDPAVVSAPFISTVVDATGLIVYFWAAKLVLGV